MKNKLLIVSRNRESGLIEKKAARNYLVIPQHKKVYLIIPSDIESDVILSLCEEISENETGDYVTYIFVKRGSELSETLNSRFPDRKHFRPVVISKIKNMYVNSADIILTRAGLVSPFDEKIEESAKFGWVTQIASSAKDAISSALKLLKRKEKAK